MAQIKSARAAMDYLAGCIAEQAELEGAPLSTVERRMLYFSEDGVLSTEMAAVSEEFDCDYNQDVYEERIGGLITRFVNRDDIDRDTLGLAMRKLGGGDMYMNILIAAACLPGTTNSSRLARLEKWLPSSHRSKDPKDALRMIVFALALLTIGLVFVAIKSWLTGVYDSWHSPYR